MNMRNMAFLAIVLAAGAAFAATSQVSAAEKFIPKGHSYAPGHERIPALNSYADRINNRADVYESEIYRKQRQRAVQRTQMQQMLSRDLNGQPSFGPSY